MGGARGKAEVSILEQLLVALRVWCSSQLLQFQRCCHVFAAQCDFCQTKHNAFQQSDQLEDHNQGLVTVFESTGPSRLISTEFKSLLISQNNRLLVILYLCRC